MISTAPRIFKRGIIRDLSLYQMHDPCLEICLYKGVLGFYFISRLIHNTSYTLGYYATCRTKAVITSVISL